MEYYERLLEECSYLQVDKERLAKMKDTLKILQDRLYNLPVPKSKLGIQ